LSAGNAHGAGPFFIAAQSGSIGTAMKTTIEEIELHAAGEQEGLEASEMETGLRSAAIPRSLHTMTLVLALLAPFLSLP
jgi:hypothetical protein